MTEFGTIWWPGGEVTDAAHIRAADDAFHELLDALNDGASVECVLPISEGGLVILRRETPGRELLPDFFRPTGDQIAAQFSDLLRNDTIAE